MDNGIHNKIHSDKAQGPLVNGVKEELVSVKREQSPDSKEASNGRAVAGDYSKLESSLQALQDAKMEEPPDELQHITADTMPLSLLLSRLAQFSHAKLQDLILSLAAKPLPETLSNGIANSGVNGSAKASAGAGGPVVEDTSPESLDKKTMVLNFIQDLHSRWVKALVITEWAKNADEVGKLIDLRTHLAEKLELYNKTFWDLVKVKQEMVFAKVPSPDLKTALEVLSRGSVHWMPDFGYLPKPPLRTQEKSHWLNEIEVTLHMRLQLHEYERIPQPWRQYRVEDGRVTFTVPGEFEVDLTISDDDFDAQFWFLDYRPIFAPAPPAISEPARAFIETQVNNILQTEGLPGCYKYLHELTLTTKIGEFARQAVELGRTGLWIESLKIEKLDRALSIQYWAQNPRSQGTPSWIMLGIHSGKASEGLYDPDTPSHIMMQWFRDGKEVKDVEIPLDVETISVEKLLTTVISKHIEHLLSSIYNALLSKPRYAQKKGTVTLQIADRPGQSSALTMQLLGKHDATLGVGMWVGNFYFAGQTLAELDWAQRFNSLRNPAQEGAALLEQIRWSYTARRLRMLPKPALWVVLPQAPVPSDEVKGMVYSKSTSAREPFHAVWVRNTQWNPQWFAMMSVSLGGDHWWLIEVSSEGRGLPGPRISTFTQLPMRPQDPLFPEISWIPQLAKHATIIMSHIEDLRNLHQRRAPHAAGKARGGGHLTTYVRSIDMLELPSARDRSASPPWAARFIPLVHKGPAPILGQEFAALIADAGSVQSPPARQRVLVEAKVGVTNRAKLALLERKPDRDVFYDHRLGQFTLRLRPDAGFGAVPLLRARMRALDRLVGMVEALRRGGKQVTPERITLREIIFTYGSSASEGLQTDQLTSPDPEKQQRWRMRLDLASEQGVDVVLEKGNPHLRVIDYLRSAANSPTFQKLPAWLILTLPLFRALERLQSSWDPVLAKEQGACYIFHKSLDWVTIRFALSGAKGRRVHLDIKPRGKEGDLAWYIYRSANDPNANNENDEFNKVLRQRVWLTDGDGFKGLSNGAVATWDVGIENLLALIGESIQSLAGTPPPAQLPQQQQQQESSAAPQQQPPEQHQQQPVPAPVPQPAARFSQQQQQAYQQQQQRGGMGGKNTPVVVLD